VTVITLRSSNRDEIDADIDRIRSLDKPRADQKRLSSRPIKLPAKGVAALLALAFLLALLGH
jgi:hypothetical protein